MSAKLFCDMRWKSFVLHIEIGINFCLFYSLFLFNNFRHESSLWRRLSTFRHHKQATFLSCGLSLQVLPLMMIPSSEEVISNDLSLGILYHHIVDLRLQIMRGIRAFDDLHGGVTSIDAFLLTYCGYGVKVH